VIFGLLVSLCLSCYLVIHHFVCYPPFAHQLAHVCHRLSLHAQLNVIDANEDEHGSMTDQVIFSLIKRGFDPHTKVYLPVSVSYEANE
jgi:hypothetical protein